MDPDLFTLIFRTLISLITYSKNQKSLTTVLRLNGFLCEIKNNKKKLVTWHITKNRVVNFGNKIWLRL